MRLPSHDPHTHLPHALPTCRPTTAAGSTASSSAAPTPPPPAVLAASTYLRPSRPPCRTSHSAGHSLS